MGLADRDYMQERHRERELRASTTFSTTKESSATSTLWIVLIWVSVFYLLFKVIGAWQVSKSKPVPPQPLAQTQAVTPRAIAPQSAPVAKETELARMRRAPNASAVAPPVSVTKCVSRSGTTYSDVPCVGSTTTTTVTRTAIRIVETPHTLEPPPQPHATYAPPETTTHPAPVAAESYSPRVEQCRALTEELHKWDDRARQPLSGQEQDWIRGKQRSLRSRSFDLRC